MTRIFDTRAPGRARPDAARRTIPAGASGGLLRRFGLWAVLVIVTVAFMIASSTFRQTNNLENILEQNSIIGVVACGMVIMMIAGGFDLSVGAVGVTASVIGAAVSIHNGTFLAIIAGLAVGIAVGAINGFLVSRVKINPFIATFAMASVVTGLLFVATAAQSKQANSPFLTALASNRWGGIPVVFVVFVVCLAAVWLTLTRTRYGHYVYSVGGNAEASHLSGVPVQRVQMFAFIAGGTFAAFAGLLLLGQTDIGQPSAAANWPLQAIAICVVAGVALTGGIGRAPDVLAATLILGVIANGLNQLNVSPYWQPTVTGLVILVAVTLDRYNRIRRTTSPPAATGPDAATSTEGQPSGRSPRKPQLVIAAAAAAAVVLAVALFAAYGHSSSGSSAKSGGSYTLGVMINDTTNPFLSTMDHALTATASKYGMKVDILNGNGDNSTELSDVQDLINKHVNAILLTPSDPVAIIPAVRAANQAGIPVFALNTAIASGGQLVTYVGDSDYKYGVAEGQLAAKAVNGHGNVAILLGVLGDSPEVQRLAGIKSVLAKYPGIKIVATPVDNWQNSQNLADTQDLLSKYPKGQLAAVIAEGPEMYVGAGYAAKTGRSDVKFIAGDYSTQVAAAIKAGQLYGTVNQSPVLEGQLGAADAYKWLTGKKSAVPVPNHYIPLPVITSANVSQYPAQWSG